jgi:hypothetical protein
MKSAASLLFAALTPVFLLTSSVFAADNAVGQSFDKAIGDVEHELVPLAEAMPDSAYNFAPPASAGAFKDVRTFAQQVKHIAATNYMIAAAVLGTKPPVDTGGEAGPASVATKEQIVAFLKGSFDYLHQAMLSITTENMNQQIPSPFTGKPFARIYVALEAAPHDNDHYGQMVVYARMNGVIPPASR